MIHGLDTEILIETIFSYIGCYLKALCRSDLPDPTVETYHVQKGAFMFAEYKRQYLWSETTNPLFSYQLKAAIRRHFRLLLDLQAQDQRR